MLIQKNVELANQKQCAPNFNLIPIGTDVTDVTDLRSFNATVTFAIEAISKVQEYERKLELGDISPASERATEPAVRILFALKRVLPSALSDGVRFFRDVADYLYLRFKFAFDRAWYLTNYPNILAAGVDPIWHYIRIGARQGYNPSAQFNTNGYVLKDGRGGLMARNVFVRYLKEQAALKRRQGRKEHILPSDQPLEPPVGWYGARPLASDEFYMDGAFAKVTRASYERGTANIVARYFPPASSAPEMNVLDRLALRQLSRRALGVVVVNSNIKKSSESPTYSIITSFYEHLGFFSHTAKSVARLIASNESAVEWIVVNDDPRVQERALRGSIPECIQSRVKILSDEKNLGISVRQNQAAQVATGEWLLFLDCDDLVEGCALNVLNFYIRKFSQCRFISSSMIDIDDDGVELRRRIRESGPDDLYEKGMTAGHLAAIRRDLFLEVGGFDAEFSGCQDYDFALRVARHEPILMIPEHLYSYRWHGRSQSVGHAVRQAVIASAVRRAFIWRLIDAPSVDSSATCNSDGTGISFIRTQGRRLDLLEEAVSSVLSQTLKVVPCIIVHESFIVFEKIQNWARNISAHIEVLHAPRVDRRRGYPLNVGLDYLNLNLKSFDFFCILDDDDVYYPLFAEQLWRKMTLSNADMVYCLTNSRVPGEAVGPAHRPLPASALVSGNFIPINAYIVRSNFLKDSSVRFNENIHYLEDWDFLLSLLGSNARMVFLDEVLSEFRIIGDGNKKIKDDAEDYRRCESVVNLRAAIAAKSRGLTALCRDFMEFDFHCYSSLSSVDERSLARATELFFVAGGEHD